MVDQFCRNADGADVAIGVVERTLLLRRLPATRRTWLRFRGGAYTGANLFALRSAAVRPAIELWRSVEQDRKKAWRILSLLGPAALALIALRLVSLDEVLARLGARLGLAVRAVRLNNPLAGVDVDKPEDHALAEAILKGEGMSDLAVYDMDRTVTRRATYTPFLIHCALRRAPWRLHFPAARRSCRCSAMSLG